MNSKIEEKLKWNLKDIYQTEEEIKKDEQKLEILLEKISGLQGKIVRSSDNLYQCYFFYEQALEIFEKIYAYGILTYHLDMANQESIKLFKKVENLGAILTTKTSFITPEITYANPETIKQYLEENTKLKKYQRDILDILEKKKHILSKEAENLLAEFTEVFSAPENTYDTLTNAELKFGKIKNEEGEEVELTDSNYSLFLKSRNQDVRKQAFEMLYQKYSEFSNTITELYLANIKTSNITAKLRNYESALEKAVIHDDASLKVYEALMEAVEDELEENYKFLELKKKMLNLKEMHFYDLYVNPCEVGKDEITFEEAKKEVLESLSVLGEEYSKQLKIAFEEHWIDVNAMPNKKSGAYSMGVYGVHPFVLTNFVNSKRDVSTIAHELGHAMHSFYSNKTMPIIDANYTIMVAEVASTVNELLLSDYQIKKEKDPTRKAELLYELLEMIRATFFRQSMFAEFEKIVHQKIDEGEMLASEDLNHIYQKLNEKYFGDTVVMDSEIQYEWARIPHFYSDFYVYKYATGISAAICIADKILKQEPGFIEKYLNMLKQGCSLKSIDLLKMVDVDLEDKQTYQKAVAFYQEKRVELEEIIKK